MTDFKLDPTLKSLGRRLDSILVDISRLPLSPPIAELLRRLHDGEKKRSTPSLDALHAETPCAILARGVRGDGHLSLRDLCGRPALHRALVRAAAEGYRVDRPDGAAAASAGELSPAG
jgi:hypothetical protein